MKVYGKIINTAPIEELYEDLKQRIDKAIEYIEETTNKGMFELRSDNGELEKLLDILKGSDKE